MWYIGCGKRNTILLLPLQSNTRMQSEQYGSSKIRLSEYRAKTWLLFAHRSSTPFLVSAMGTT